MIIGVALINFTAINLNYFEINLNPLTVNMCKVKRNNNNNNCDLAS